MITRLTTGLCLMLAAPAAIAAPPAMHIVSVADPHWQPADPGLPKGAQQEVLAGDPSKPGPFAIRFLMPAGYEVPLHTHPSAENITLISGSILHEMSADRARATRVGTGDYVYLPPHMAHAVWTGDTPAVVQINGTGPFTITYVDAKDDPRR